MAKGIGVMIELQVLSHVTVSKTSSDLIELGSLLQLRKLGVVIQGPQGRVCIHLYHTIAKLSRSLRTLSIQIIDDNEDADIGVGVEERLLMPPKYLQKLKISSLTASLPLWVRDLKELRKITLHKTLLTAADIEIIGMLPSLYHIWLRQESCSEQTLTFSKDGFHCLKFLVLECPNITSINFADKATTKLKNMVRSSTGSQLLCLSGIEHLQSLKELKLTGNFNHERVQQAIAANKNNLVYKTE